MSKYDTLSERLAAHSGNEWRPSFSELEGVLGFALPKAARAGRAWWANDPDKSHSRAWTIRGWEVGDVDHAAERVVFRRGAASGVTLIEAAGLQPLGAPSEVQRPALRNASARTPAKRAIGLTALVAGGVAVTAGLAALAVKGLMRRRGA